MQCNNGDRLINPTTHKCKKCESFSKRELQEYARLLSLPTRGTKDELCARFAPFARDFDRRIQREFNRPIQQKCNRVETKECRTGYPGFRRVELPWQTNQDDIPVKKWYKSLNDQLKWDKLAAPNSLRILTQNLHYRPYESDAYLTNKTDKICVELQFQNAQERRACELVGTIARLERWERPHIICLQEATQQHANIVLYEGLERIGYVGVSHLLARQPKYKTMTQAERRARDYVGGYYTNPPGLAIFVDQSFEAPSGQTLKFIDTDEITFKAAAGADYIGNKGALLVRVRIPRGLCGCVKDTDVVVVCIHPSPYVRIEGFWTGLVCRNAKDYADVLRIHKEQMRETSTFIESYLNKFKRGGKKKLGGLFITGDMNINRYAVEPDSVDEKDARTASVCCSSEFFKMLKLLGADQPPVVPDPNKSHWSTYTTNEEGDPLPKPLKMPAGRGGYFTWDGELNAITKSPLWPDSFSWIDYVLYYHGARVHDDAFVGNDPVPLYMDNRAFRLNVKGPFPELGAQHQPACLRHRARKINQLRDKYVGGTDICKLVDMNEEVEDRVDRRKRKKLDRKPFDLTKWDNTYEYQGESFTCTFETESQNVSNPAFQVSSGKRGTRKGDLLPKTGAHPFPMLQDVSDHYGVMSVVLLDTAPNQTLLKESYVKFDTTSLPIARLRKGQARRVTSLDNEYDVYRYARTWDDSGNLKRDMTSARYRVYARHRDSTLEDYPHTEYIYDLVQKNPEAPATKKRKLQYLRDILKQGTFEDEQLSDESLQKLLNQAGNRVGWKSLNRVIDEMRLLLFEEDVLLV